MTIIVGGYIIGYPLGGMTWHHLNYVLGLHELGHEVWFLEDSGPFSLPYNPVKQLCEPDSSFGRRYLEETFAAVGLPLRYCYYSEFEDRYHGLGRDELRELTARTDLMLCVSGVTPLRPDRGRPRRTVVIDTDPAFTQIRMGQSQALLDYYRQFDAVATFGRLVGSSESPLPTHGIRWIPTNQPVSLRHWQATPAQSRRFTTIGKWEHSTDRHVEFNGKRYLSSKAVEWLNQLELPSRTNWELSLAVQSMPAEIQGRFQQAGWTFADAETATRDCRSYQQFIRESAGEFTVAKQLYVQLPSGWFSDRSACYLASGRPVVTQSTGFERWLPTGEGLLSFGGIDDAAAALAAVEAKYESHSRAARDIAERYFDSAKVLMGLLDAVL